MDPEKGKELPKQLKKFYKGEPLALGITQILIGIIEIVFGIVLNVSSISGFFFMYLIVMIPHWTGILFIISGSLSVAASRNPKPSLVKGMLGMNTVSVVAAGIAIVFLSISLLETRWHVRYRCSYYSSSEVDPSCYETIVIPHNIMVGVMSVLLLLTVLEFCISISNAAFGCKTLCRNSYTETVVVLYQNPSPENAFNPQAAREGKVAQPTLGDTLSGGDTSPVHDYGNLGHF